MCVILYKPIGVPAIKKDWLENAVSNNSDGWGVAVRSKEGQITVQRGFDDNTFVELGQQWGEEYDVVVHARIATSGGVNIQNLHPFPIMEGKDSDNPVAYLFHNGIIATKDISPWSPLRSDSWHLSQIWTNTYGQTIIDKARQRGWRRRQKRWLGSYNKFVIMDNKGVSIINPNAGFWEENIWHSNDTAKLYKYFYYTKNSCIGGWDGDGDATGYHKKAFWSAIYDSWGLYAPDKKGQYKWVEMAKNYEDLPDELRPAYNSQTKTYVFGHNINKPGPLHSLPPAVPVKSAKEAAKIFQEHTTVLSGGLDKEDAAKPYLYDVSELPLVKRASDTPLMDAINDQAKEDEAKKAAFLDELMRAGTIADIEEATYNYDSFTIAITLSYLMRKAGYYVAKTVV